MEEFLERERHGGEEDGERPKVHEINSAMRPGVPDEVEQRAVIDKIPSPPKG